MKSAGIEPTTKTLEAFIFPLNYDFFYAEEGLPLSPPFPFITSVSATIALGGFEPPYQAPKTCRLGHYLIELRPKENRTPDPAMS